MIFGNYDRRNYCITLERNKRVFPLSLVRYTKYTKPYALRQQISVRYIVTSHCVSFDKQAVSQ